MSDLWFMKRYKFKHNYFNEVHLYENKVQESTRWIKSEMMTFNTRLTLKVQMVESKWNWVLDLQHCKWIDQIKMAEPFFKENIMLCFFFFLSFFCVNDFFVMDEIWEVIRPPYSILLESCWGRGPEGENLSTNRFLIQKYVKSMKIITFPPCCLTLQF